MTIRLNKLLAQRGLGARRKCDELIQEGRVRINGEVVREPGTQVELERDHVEVNGKRLPAPAQHRYFVLNKPVGVITTLHDPEGRRTIAQFLPPGGRMFPVGRLDADTSGLLLLTNDGELAHHLMHPRYGVEKTYRVWVSHRPNPGQIARLGRGVEFETGVTSAPARVRMLSAEGERGLVEITIHEGRYRQVRRMCEAVGLEVTGLHRSAYGPLRLGPLERGLWRELSDDEVAQLRETSARPHARSRRGRGAGGEFFSARRGRVSTVRPTAGEGATDASPPRRRGPRPTGQPADRARAGSRPGHATRSTAERTAAERTPGDRRERPARHERSAPPERSAPRGRASFRRESSDEPRRVGPGPSRREGSPAAFPPRGGAERSGPAGRMQRSRPSPGEERPRTGRGQVRSGPPRFQPRVERPGSRPRRSDERPATGEVAERPSPRRGREQFGPRRDGDERAGPRAGSRGFAPGPPGPDRGFAPWDDRSRAPRGDRKDGFTPRGERKGGFASRGERKEGSAPAGEPKGRFATRAERQDGFAPRGELKGGFAPRGGRQDGATSGGERKGRFAPRGERRGKFAPHGEGGSAPRGERRGKFAPRGEGGFAPRGGRKTGFAPLSGGSGPASRGTGRGLAPRPGRAGNGYRGRGPAPRGSVGGTGSTFGPRRAIGRSSEGRIDRSSRRPGPGRRVGTGKGRASGPPRPRKGFRPRPSRP